MTYNYHINVIDKIQNQNSIITNDNGMCTLIVNKQHSKQNNTLQTDINTHGHVSTGSLTTIAVQAM